MNAWWIAAAILCPVLVLALLYVGLAWWTLKGAGAFIEWVMGKEK